jgi:hypothetical protein
VLAVETRVIDDSPWLDQAVDRACIQAGRGADRIRPARRRFVSRELLLEAFASAPRLDADGFRDELDGVVDETVEPRA